MLTLTHSSTDCTHHFLLVLQTFLTFTWIPFHLIVDMLEEMCTYVGQKFGNGKILVFVSVMVYVFLVKQT